MRKKAGNFFEKALFQLFFASFVKTGTLAESHHPRGFQVQDKLLKAYSKVGMFLGYVSILSQTAACDGNNYQVAPNEANGLYLPTGVLPL